MISVGRRIQVWREHRGFSQAEFAKLLEMSPPNLCRMESGKQSPNSTQLEKIAQALGLSLSQFFGAIGSEEAKAS